MGDFHYFRQCVSCGKKFQPDRFLYTCPDCHDLLMVERDEEYVRGKIGQGGKAREEKIINAKDLVVSISTASAIKLAESGIRHHKTRSKEDFANPYEILEGNLEAIEKSFKNV